jgi:hypothetical protein
LAGADAVRVQPFQVLMDETLVSKRCAMEASVSPRFTL